ncbi:MAG: ferrous iron transport protein A [Desulfobacteraceae bacterium]|nr:ferrous iron transport protein A [Desulfobacteraceae bacterium]
MTRLDEEILVKPVKVKGPTGERILGRGMATKVVAHLDDGRKLPIAELKPGESGHIEGIVGGTGLADALSTLGLKNDDKVSFVRVVPPMEYTVLVVSSGQRVRLSEGVAAKIWGTMKGRELQFCSAARGEEFHVKKVLGGQRAQRAVFMHGNIEAGSLLRLEGVAPAETFNMHREIDPVVIMTHGGLRLILEKTSCTAILVEKADD